MPREKNVISARQQDAELFQATVSQIERYTATKLSKLAGGLTRPTIERWAAGRPVNPASEDKLFLALAKAVEDDAEAGAAKVAAARSFILAPG